MDMNDVPPPREPGVLMKALMWLTGMDPERMRDCPKHDYGVMQGLAVLMALNWTFESALFTLTGHRLFARPGEIRPELVLGAIFLATFILMIDSFMIMRSGWHLNGIEDLKRAGLDVSGGPIERIKAAVFVFIRVALAGTMAQLMGLFVSILIFATDINARIDGAYLTANAHLLGPATELVDATIKRATDAVNAEAAHVNALSGEIEVLRRTVSDPSSRAPGVPEAQEEVTQLIREKAKADQDVATAQTFANNEGGGIKGAPGNSGKPGYSFRYRAAQQQVADAKTRARQIDKDLDAARSRLDALRAQIPAQDQTVAQRARDQLPGFEKSFQEETAKLTNLRADLAKLIADRENAIRRAIDNAPDHIKRDDGLLRQIIILAQIGREDTKIAAVIILIDGVFFSLELAAVVAKLASSVPTGYSLFLARDAYMRAVRIVDEMMTELKNLETPPTMPGDEPLSADEVSDDAPPLQPTLDANGTAPEPPKRKRGRPRKHPLPAPPKGANGRGEPEQGPGESGPA
jgi:Domain of unknown function (DUF4407)